MSWNYRVVRTEYPNPVTGKSESRYGIHEAYYDAGQEHPHSITLNPTDIHEASLDDLRDTLDIILQAFKLPVLEASDFDSDTGDTVVQTPDTSV